MAVRPPVPVDTDCVPDCFVNFSLKNLVLFVKWSSAELMTGKARVLLVPFLDDIVQTLVRAFQYFQAKPLSCCA